MYKQEAGKANSMLKREGKIAVNGIELGMVERDGGPRGTLVLLHGFTGSAHSWDSLLDRMAEEGLRVIALDMLGHGESSAPEDAQRYAIEECEKDILAALKQLGVGPGEAILLGYSMGGRIALSSALSGYFRALILESASPGLADPTERAQRRASDSILAERIEREGVDAFISYWEKIPLFASQQRLPIERQNKLHRQRLRNNARGLANSLRGVGTGAQPALHARLADLKLPVLLIAGTLDPKFWQIGEQMARELPQAQLKLIENAGHTVHLEEPEIFVREISEFCQSVLR